MYSDVQPFIKEDVQQTFIKQYKMLRHKLLTLLDTPVKQHIILEGLATSTTLLNLF